MVAAKRRRGERECGTMRDMRVLRSKWLWWPIGVLVALVVTVVVAFNVSAYPGAMLTRFVFERGADATAKRNAQFAVPDKVVVTHDVEYIPADSTVPRGDPGDTRLDVYLPVGVSDEQVLPAVVWIHGGGWLSGDKTNTAFYFEQLASNGFAVVAVNYSLAPEYQYPTAITQLNAALGYLARHGRGLHVDATRLVLAGDSAGGQLAAQLAAVLSNPGYAAQVGVTAAVPVATIRGAVLNCGVYDMAALSATGGAPKTAVTRVLSWGVDNTMWALGGQRSGNPTMLAQMSSIDFVTPRFPRVWISGGNDDPLTARQTMPFIAKLQAVGVPTQSLLFPADYPEKLKHEYQFELGTTAGQQALTQTVAFVEQVTK